MPEPRSHLIAEISKSAIAHNLELLRQELTPPCGLWPVVKADAYGLGIAGIWETIAEASDGLCVATTAEALELRSLGYSGRILVMLPLGAQPPGGESAAVLAAVVAAGGEFTVSDPEHVARLEAALSSGDRAAVHLKIDTGMHRGGASMESAGELLEMLRRSKVVEIEAVYTHFATAEEAEREFSHTQLQKFMTWTESAGLTSLPRHAAASAATFEMPESHLDLVRPGLAVYGYQPSPHLASKPKLEPALRLVTHLMKIKEVDVGESCGYGLTHRFERPSRIGLLPVGYADGYPRALGNRGSMRIHGQDVPVRGTVAMDQTIVDVTDVPQAAVGDEIEVFGNDPKAVNAIESLASLCPTIPYEILNRLGNRVERRVVS